MYGIPESEVCHTFILVLHPVVAEGRHAAEAGLEVPMASVREHPDHIRGRPEILGRHRAVAVSEDHDDVEIGPEMLRQTFEEGVEDRAATAYDLGLLEVVLVPDLRHGIPLHLCVARHQVSVRVVAEDL